MEIVYLSRRNLETLLAKLNRVKEGGHSACAILKQDDQHPKYPQSMPQIIIQAIENEDYYTAREPGRMVEDEIGKTQT